MSPIGSHGGQSTGDPSCGGPIGGPIAGPIGGGPIGISGPFGDGSTTGDGSPIISGGPSGDGSTGDDGFTAGASASGDTVCSGSKNVALVTRTLSKKAPSHKLLPGKLET